MLLSRKRLRDTTESPLLRGPEQQLLAFKTATPSDGGKRLLRDVVDATASSRVSGRDGGSGGLLDLLARLQEREATTTNDMSRAHVNSQELFLSVVLEWQRSGETTRRANESVASPTAAVFHHDRAFRSVQNNRDSYASSSYASSSSSDDEQDDTTAKKQPREEVSPTSVHNVPRTTPLTPLHLSEMASTSTTKRIGIYSPRARQELLRNYMLKRARRLSQHKVRYGVRKTLANARPRVKGRFVKTETPLTAALVVQQGALGN